ncbi:unnamed protein product, partial [Allacma fusca]
MAHFGDYCDDVRGDDPPADENWVDRDNPSTSQGAGMMDSGLQEDPEHELRRSVRQNRGVPPDRYGYPGSGIRGRAKSPYGHATPSRRPGLPRMSEGLDLLSLQNIPSGRRSKPASITSHKTAASQSSSTIRMRQLELEARFTEAQAEIVRRTAESDAAALKARLMAERAALEEEQNSSDEDREEVINEEEDNGGKDIPQNFETGDTQPRVSFPSDSLVEDQVPPTTDPPANEEFQNLRDESSHVQINTRWEQPSPSHGRSVGWWHQTSLVQPNHNIQTPGPYAARSQVMGLKSQEPPAQVDSSKPSIISGKYSMQNVWGGVLSGGQVPSLTTGQGATFLSSSQSKLFSGTSLPEWPPPSFTTLPPQKYEAATKRAEETSWCPPAGPGLNQPQVPPATSTNRQVHIQQQPTPPQPPLSSSNAPAEVNQTLDRLTSCMEVIVPRIAGGSDETRTFMARQAMQRDLPLFSGEAEEWANFAATFLRSTNSCRFANDENLSRLQKCLRGKARDVVQALLVTPENVPEILRTLEFHFGQPEDIIGSMIAKAEAAVIVREDKPELMMDFCSIVKNMVATMISLRKEEHLGNPMLVKKLLAKLPPNYKLYWVNQARSWGRSDLQAFATWLWDMAQLVQLTKTDFKPAESKRKDKPGDRYPKALDKKKEMVGTTGAVHAIVDQHYMHNYLVSFRNVQEAKNRVQEVYNIHTYVWRLQNVQLADERPTVTRLDTCSPSGYKCQGPWHRIRTSARKDSRTIMGPKLKSDDLTWDEAIPELLVQKWEAFRRRLDVIASISIPRCYGWNPDSILRAELHIFCDASEQGYAAVAYFRFETPSSFKTAFVFAKSKVAPLKFVTIPRLELMAAVMAVRLAKTVQTRHELIISSTNYWTDSQIVLTWLRSDARKFQTFVANRVGEIEESSEAEQWNWVPSELNTADFATRDKDVDSEL